MNPLRRIGRSIRHAANLTRLAMATDQRAISPAGWAHIASEGRWVCAPHLDLLNQKLVNLARGRAQGRGGRLIVTIPPRHGKSEMISKYFPGWWLGMFPDDRVILTSYEAEFAATWGKKAQETFRDYAPGTFGLHVDPNTSAASRWNVQGRNGGMDTAGVGGPLTGKGAHCLIIDDPVKNAEEAASELRRNNAWEWFQSTAYTRIEPGGACVILMTRWHEDDLAGRVIAHAQEFGEPWEVIRIPALSETHQVYAEITRYGRAS
jgi:hypothetical protein